MVDYARTQGPLYDRLPLRQYCQTVPVVRGKMQIPQITAGLTVRKGTTENNAPAASDPTINKLDIDLTSYAAAFQISGLADLYSGPGFLTSFLMSDVIPLVEEEINADIITAALAVSRHRRRDHGRHDLRQAGGHGGQAHRGQGDQHRQPGLRHGRRPVHDGQVDPEVRPTTATPSSRATWAAWAAC